jgi:hypothetical protein
MLAVDEFYELIVREINMCAVDVFLSGVEEQAVKSK